ncbi:MAG: MFS transporter [Beijerinckiaceae bacterium]
MSIGLRLAPQHRIFAAFALHAISMGSIFPRMPDIKADMGIAEGTLGLSLIGLPAGTLTALTFAAPALERIGFRRSLLAVSPLVALTYAIAVHATSPVGFFLLLIPVGFFIGCVEIIINVEADRTEVLIKRRIMNRAHAFWSFGFFVAGLLGASMAQLGVSPQVQLALVALFTVTAVMLCLGQYQPAPPRISGSDAAKPRFARPTMPILVLVGITFSALLMEGAGIDWSAIYMHDVFSSGPFMAGLAVAVVALTQAISRYFADGFVDRHSPSGVARLLLWVLAAGILCVFFSLSPMISLFGFALIGIGTSAIFPLAVSAAARRTDRTSATNVAALVQIAFTAFLLGPPLLGLVAEHWGIEWAFGVALPFVAISILNAGALGKNPGNDGIAGTDLPPIPAIEKSP